MGDAFSRVSFFHRRSPSVSRSEASTRPNLLSLSPIAGLLRRDQDRRTAISWLIVYSLFLFEEKSGKTVEEEGAELRATRSKRPRERSVGSRSISMVFRSRSLRMQRLRGGMGVGQRARVVRIYSRGREGRRKEGFPTPRGENGEETGRERERERAGIRLLSRFKPCIRNI